MAKGRKKREQRPRSGFLTKVVIFALLGILGWQLYGMQGQLAEAREEQEYYAARVAEQERENAALQADIDEGPTEEKLLEIARDEFGMVKPGEYVFRTGN